MKMNYDDVKKRYVDGFHAIAFMMDFVSDPRLSYARKNVDTSTGRTSIFWPHWHDDLEILALLDGNLILTIGGEEITLSAGDTIVIPPLEGHGAMCPAGGGMPRYFCMLVEPKRFITGKDEIFDAELEKINDRTMKYNMVFRNGSEESRILQDSVRDVAWNCPKNCHDAAMQAVRISAVYRCFSVILGAKTGYDASPEKKNMDFIRRAAEIISKEFDTPLTSRGMAERMNYEYTHFCHLFRDNFGENFSNYLRNYRIKRSVDYRGTGLPVAQVAARVGFDNYSYFSTSFREIFGVSPREYFGK